jgi:PST family polysaccharide transporter
MACLIDIKHSKYLKNGMWLLLLQVFKMIAPLITLPYIIRIMPVSTYGEFVISLNWITYLLVLVEYGFGLTGAQKIAVCSENNAERSKVRCNILFAQFFLLIPCALILFVLCFFSSVNHVQILCMLILFLEVLSVAFQQNWFFQGICEMQNITLVNVISRLISIVLIFLFVKSQDDLFLYCFLYASTSIISSVVGCVIAKRKYKLTFYIPNVSSILKEIKDGWSLFISSFMTKIFTNVGVTILGFVALKEEVGAYAVIYKITFILTLLFSAVSQSIYPQNCKVFANESFDLGVKNVKKIAFPVLLFFLFGCVVLIVVRNYVVKIAFGSMYLPYAYLLVPFAVWTFFGILNNFLGIQTLVASNHKKQYSVAFTLCIISSLLLMLLLGRISGVLGVAVGSMLGEIILTLILLFYISRISKETAN